MKKQSRKIDLRTETVRTLTNSGLALVAGGLAQQSFDYCGSGDSCISIGCSSGIPCTNSTISC